MPRFRKNTDVGGCHGNSELAFLVPVGDFLAVQEYADSRQIVGIVKKKNTMKTFSKFYTMQNLNIINKSDDFRR